MWENLNQYTNHLKQIHKLSSDFKEILSKNFERPPCSHVLINEVWTNLLENYEKKEVKKVYYLLQTKKYDQLYFCKCLWG